MPASEMERSRLPGLIHRYVNYHKNTPRPDQMSVWIFRKEPGIEFGVFRDTMAGLENQEIFSGLPDETKQYIVETLQLPVPAHLRPAPRSAPSFSVVPSAASMSAGYGGAGYSAYAPSSSVVPS
ncbi:hypothetical protein, partial [Micromonospora sp. ALFpr18c]